MFFFKLVIVYLVYQKTALNRIISYPVSFYVCSLNAFIIGSWVKLDPSRNGHSHNTSPKLSDGEEMETLLAEAVEEQMKQSRYTLAGNQDIFYLSC